MKDIWVRELVENRFFQLFPALCVSVAAHALLALFIPVGTSYVFAVATDIEVPGVNPKKTLDVKLIRTTGAEVSSAWNLSKPKSDLLKKKVDKQRMGGLGLTGLEPTMPVAAVSFDKLPELVFVPPLDREFMRDFPEEVRIEVKVEVDEKGQVVRVETVSGNSFFMSAIEQALFFALFKPGRVNGRDVAGSVVMEIVFPALTTSDHRLTEIGGDQK